MIDIGLRVALHRWTVAPPAFPPLFRFLHEAELPSHLRTNPLRRPEVRPTYPNHFSDFRRDGQLLSRAMNPRISDDKWTNVYGTNLWIANDNGFGNEADPRRNYVTGANPTAGDPKVECLCTGGSVVTGYISDRYLVIDVLDCDNLPSLDWIMERPWYWTYAVTVDGNLQPRRFAQGLQPNGEVVPIIHPLIGNPGRFPTIMTEAWRVVPWRESYMPDPYKVYNPV